MKRTTAVSWTILAVGFGLLAVQPAAANNIAVTNVALVNQNMSAQTVDVQFDLSWQNSWRTVPNTNYPAYTNWDAAWVFVKFEPAGLSTNAWRHAILSTTTSDHTPAANSMITPSSDGVGAFVYRSSGYTGDVSYTSMRLRWNYGANGQTWAKGTTVAVSVQAIEMVYVPQGPFYLGSTGNDPNHFYDPTISAQTTNAFVVSSENAITIGTGSGNLYYTGAGGAGGDGLGVISIVFPKGYNAFYCMKYDLTQQQYCDFLNMLTRPQQNTRTANQTASTFAMNNSASILNRNGIRCPSVIPGTGTNITFGCDGDGDGNFNQPGDAMDRTCNYLSWSDGAAYAAWAGLRPMTELEFEKACRGVATPVKLEDAWGNNTVYTSNGEVNDGFGTSTSPLANYVGVAATTSGNAPCRAGVFATSSSTRTQAGASYWGIMELSGNLFKQVMTVGNSTGRVFTASNGSGILDASGKSTNADWNTDGAGFDAKGTGNRGGSWNSGSPAFGVSDRTSAISANTSRQYQNGWRGVRSAP